MATPSLADITDAITAELNALFPAYPVSVRRRPPGQNRHHQPGFSAADLRPGGQFLVVTGDPEPVDGAGDFEGVSVRYVIDIVYAKPAPPGDRDEDPDVRAVRDAVLDRLYRPRLTGVAGALVVGFDSGPPYENVDLPKTFNFATQTMVVHVRRQRGVS